MSDVPSELLQEILFRLPAESLLRFRIVCKEWVRIIDDPTFIKAHTNNQLYSHTLLIRNETGAPLFSFCLDSLNFMNGSQMIDATRIKNLIYPGVSLFSVASCNGLIFIEMEDRESWVILNPSTKECHNLPKPNTASSKLFLGYGFGYDSVSDDYKVVGIYELFFQKKVVFQTLIYSLKSDSWGTVEDSPRSSVLQWDSGLGWKGTFLNGSLYWTSMSAIIALDLGTESYCQLPLPIAPVVPRLCFGVRLDALDGCLICSLYDKEKEKGTFDGWVMKDNGVEKTRIKLFSLQDSVFRGLTLVAYFKRKEQVLVQYLDGFLWFDIGNSSIKKCSIHGLDITSSLICPGSLVQLSDYRGSHIGFKARKTEPVTGKRKMKMRLNTKRTDTRNKFVIIC